MCADSLVPAAGEAVPCASKPCFTAACLGRMESHPGQLGSAADELPPIRLPMEIPQPFIAEVLEPYRPHARYLRSARITELRDKSSPVGGGAGLVTGTGRFTIPSSCYIDDTGHFNAVEFNICFNQLAYVLFGKCIESDVLKRLRLEKGNVTFAEFKRHQLSSMLIVRIESRYYNVLKCGDFGAELTIDRISASAGVYFCFTSVSFFDADGVKAKGTVLLAFSPSRH